MEFIIGEETLDPARERFHVTTNNPAGIATGERVIGIRSRIGEHLILNAGLSSPFRPATPPTRADSFAVPA